MDGLVDLGVVSDVELLLCGPRRPVRATPWWTRSLVDLGEAEVASRVDAVAASLAADGDLDPATGGMTGRLARVQQVVADQDVTVLVGSACADGTVERRSVVVRGDDVLLLRARDGGHDGLAVGREGAARLLGDLLGALSRPPSAAVVALVGDRAPAEVAEVLPEADRVRTTWLTRAVRRPPSVDGLTVIDHAAGSVVCHAVPGGRTRVEVLTPEAADRLAAALVGCPEVAV